MRGIVLQNRHDKDKARKIGKVQYGLETEVPVLDRRQLTDARRSSELCTMVRFAQERAHSLKSLAKLRRSPHPEMQLFLCTCEVLRLYNTFVVGAQPLAE